MNLKRLTLNELQIGSFDRFLLDGTGKVLNALETMYELEIDRSDSSIEIGPANDSEALKHIGSGTLYTFSSSLLGDMRGSIQLMMRSADFDYMVELMKPILSLLFLSSPNTDLKTLDSQKPGWMEDHGIPSSGDVDFYDQLMDAVVEMGNVLIGLYTKAIYNMCALSAHHSIPEVVRNPGQGTTQEVLATLQISDQLLLVIENEFHIRGKPIKLWCVISLTKGSFQDLLNIIECSNEHQQKIGKPARPVQNHLPG